MNGSSNNSITLILDIQMFRFNLDREIYVDYPVIMNQILFLAAYFFANFIKMVWIIPGYIFSRLYFFQISRNWTAMTLAVSSVNRITSVPPSKEGAAQATHSVFAL